MKLVSGDQVRAALANREEEILETVARAYLAHDAGASSLPHSTFLRFPGRRKDRIIALPAYLADGFELAGIKWISSFPANVGYGRPRASAVLVLNSCGDGTPVAILEGSVISAQRTAASATLAARALCADAPEVVGVVGTGLIAAEVVRFLGCALPEPRQWLLRDLDPVRAARFADRLRETKAGEVVVARRAEDVLAHASLIVIATTASRPHVHDVRGCPPGAVLLHVSLRDLSPEAILACDNVVDDVNHVLRAETSLHLAEEATGRRDFIRCTLAQVLRGDAPPRRHDALGTVFSPFGLGVLDLAVGGLALERAVAAGTFLEVDHFMPSKEVFI